MKKSLLISILALLGMTQAVAQDAYPLLPMVQEGKKWVNEKVVINHGDTVYNYYTYEITGKVQNILYPLTESTMICQYYEGASREMTNDSIICYLEENDFSDVDCFFNLALDRVENEGRNLIKRIEYVSSEHREALYFLNRWHHYYLPDGLPGLYIEYQLEPFLTEENFYQVESIDIEGYDCHRYAHVDQEGNIICYLVEGIGFDSRDMGDLLTPFTRKPDPDADYQEYWGLSHVIKDGKIIYKGMRYNEDHLSAVGEVAADRQRAGDSNYYNLMGQPVGKDVPTAPGIYIHQGKKIIVR